MATQAPTGESATEPGAGCEKGVPSPSEAYGVPELVGDALSKVCLSDEQRAKVEQLGKQVAPKVKEVAEARHAFLAAAAEQLRSGQVDEHALRDEIDVLVKAREDASPTLRKAFEQLHDTLDPSQRAAFVDAIEARMKEIGEKSKAWLDTFAKDVDLSSDQKSQIADALGAAKPELHEERSMAKAIFEAFKGDKFSTEAILPEAKVGERTRAAAEETVLLAKAIADILKPEQRAEIAKKIESKSAPESGCPAAGTAPTGSEHADESKEALIAARGGFRAGAVRGWGGGYAARGVYARSGYAAGYPLVGGWGPGIW
jgi:Spy/CpxP family protein refolding chaperone